MCVELRHLQQQLAVRIRENNRRKEALYKRMRQVQVEQRRQQTMLQANRIVENAYRKYMVSERAPRAWRRRRIWASDVHACAL